ncbi:DUF3077 domain-containing protein [Pseudomonas sp. TE3610]
MHIEPTALTLAQPFGPLDRNNEPLFTVREGLHPADALTHASLLLGYAGAVAYEIADSDTLVDQRLARAIIPLIDAAKALVDACPAH